MLWGKSVQLRLWFVQYFITALSRKAWKSCNHLISRRMQSCVFQKAVRKANFNRNGWSILPQSIFLPRSLLIYMYSNIVIRGYVRCAYSRGFGGCIGVDIGDRRVFSRTWKAGHALRAESCQDAPTTRWYIRLRATVYELLRELISLGRKIESKKWEWGSTSRKTIKYTYLCASWKSL